MNTKTINWQGAMLKEIFQRHKEVILFYSGGKDSLALLLLLRPYWDRVNVVWVDTGNQFPEVIEHMEKVKALVPRFTTLHGDQPKYFLEHGFAVDVVPEKNTLFGQLSFGAQPVTCVARFQCCGQNLWKPMEDFVLATRPTCVLRADRSSEREKGPAHFGETEILHPLWDWTNEQIWEFIEKNGKELLQDRHKMAYRTSLDCMVCMGYFNGVKERLGYLKTYHPELHEKAVRFFKAYKQTVEQDLEKVKVE